MKQTIDTRTQEIPLGGRGPYKKAKPKTFGAYVAHLRGQRNMTQVQYAQAVRVSRRSLAMAEKLQEHPAYIHYRSTLFDIANFEFGASFYGPVALLRKGFEAWKDAP